MRPGAFKFRVKKCANFCWTDQPFPKLEVDVFMRCRLTKQQRPNQCLMCCGSCDIIRLLIKICGLEWFAQVKLCILWPHGASVSQWSLSLNKWDEYTFQKMRWWMNMWHQSLPRPSVPMSMPTPQSLFALSLFNCHMTGWISWDSDSIITVAESQTLWPGTSVIWIKLMSCESAGFHIAMGKDGKSDAARHFEPGHLRIHYQARNWMNVVLIVWEEVLCM